MAYSSFHFPACHQSIQYQVQCDTEQQSEEIVKERHRGPKLRQNNTHEAKAQPSRMQVKSTNDNIPAHSC